MFSLEAIKTLKKSGTVTPSSRFLVDKMTKNINGKDLVIVEFGTGNGKITKRILNKASRQSTVLSFELNKTMYQKAHLMLPEDDRLCLINNPASTFDLTLQEKNLEQVDCFISSLPLSLLKKSDIQALLDKVSHYLHRDGMFIQYQYSLEKYDFLKQHFSEVKLNFTPLNFPPAFVYKCSN